MAARNVDEDRDFKDMFINIDTNSQKKSRDFTDAVAKKNVKKNRYPNILPYDHSLVKLTSLDGKTPVYINANYIKGHTNDREYIASQGPLENTADDHWLMIWQNDVKLIIMLTNCEEAGVQKCHQYWPSVPNSQMVKYGSIGVTLVSESVKGAYVERQFEIQPIVKGSAQNIGKMVHQLQFLNWQDRDVPQVADFRPFFTAARTHMKGLQYTQPVLVHCSSGTGRTGVFIALDLLWRLRPDIEFKSYYNIVMQLRSCRRNMVQTPAQLAFIESCILQFEPDQK